MAIFYWFMVVKKGNALQSPESLNRPIGQRTGLGQALRLSSLHCTTDDYTVYFLTLGWGEGIFARPRFPPPPNLVPVKLARRLKINLFECSCFVYLTLSVRLLFGNPLFLLLLVLSIEHFLLAQMRKLLEIIPIKEFQT